MPRLTTAILLLFAAGAAFGHGFGNFAEDCSSSRFHFDGRTALTKEEVIEAGALASLRTSVSNVPLSVSGGHAGGYTIRVCKAAVTAADLDAIQVTFQHGDLRAEGPEHGRWSVRFHIEAPDGGKLELEAENGPVSIRDYDGSLTVRTTNGPLSLKNVSGQTDATTQNGPISLSGGSGSMKLKAANGPLSIRLDGATWSGSGLDAGAVNGPVTLALPRGYTSGVVVETRGRSPIACRAEACGRAREWRADWSDEPQTIELGSGPVAVRLSAGNGPVTIRETE